MNRGFLPELWPREAALSLSQQAVNLSEIHRQFSMNVSSLTIPLPHVLVDGSSRRCSWTGSPSTNWQLLRFTRVALNGSGRDSHRFLENISFCATVFPARMGISKVEGLNSKIGGNGSPEASLPPVRYPRRPLTHPPATPSASLATNSYPEITQHS